MNGPLSKISHEIFLKIFFSRVVQKYSYMIEWIFNVICDIVMSIVMVVTTDVMSMSALSLL